MQTLDILRGISGAIWILVLLCLSGSVFRAFRKKERHLDRSWVLCWLFASMMTGFAWRAYHGLAIVPKPGADYVSLVGLNILSIMIAALVLFRRWTYGERRW